MMLTIVLTCLFCCTEAHTSLLRVFGGRDAHAGEFPYVVEIVYGKRYEFRCTASVLSETWTLTAAHCVDSSDWKRYVKKGTAMIGYQPSVKSETTYSKIVSLKIHPAYKKVTAETDIALLQTEPVYLTKYGRLSAIDYSTLFGQEVKLVGYGMYNYTTDVAFPIPQVLEAIARECQNTKTYSQPTICFAPRCSSPPHVEQALCYGDSGGPAIHASGIIAVTSTSETEVDFCIEFSEKLRKDSVRRFSIAASAPTGLFVDWISNVISKQDLQINI